MTVQRKSKTKLVVKEEVSAANPEVTQRKGMIRRTATEEDYRLRAVATIGTFFRAKDMKPK
jgi:hypothetical protein